MNRRGPVDGYAEDDWRTLMAINVDGPFLVTRAVLPGMKARRRGKIVNICSLASDLGRPNIVPYAASKGGLKQFTRALAVELAPHNMQVNGIAPGFFRTEMNAALVADAEFSAWVERRTPAGRWGEPPEIAGAAVFLASPARRLRHRRHPVRRRRLRRVVLTRRPRPRRSGRDAAMADPGARDAMDSPAFRGRIQSLASGEGTATRLPRFRVRRPSRLAAPNAARRPPGPPP